MKLFTFIRMKKNIKFCFFISLCIILPEEIMILLPWLFPNLTHMCMTRHGLKVVAQKISFVNLYSVPLQQANMKLKECDALLVTMGEDVNPALYNKEGELGICGELDKRRGTLQISSIKLAMQLYIPIPGICRR